jgi:glycine/D-amino acid oxidase-like deaminating enzyme
MPDINVVGGGIAGITLSLTAAVKGYDVKLYTSERADRVPPQKAGMDMATPVGGGNIEPIGVEDQEMLELFDSSLAFYEALSSSDYVEQKPFYLISMAGESIELPYADRLEGFEEVSEEEINFDIDEDSKIYRYEVFGADNDLLEHLYDSVEEIGVDIIEKELTPGQILDLEGVKANCMGIRGPELYGNSIESEMNPVKGSLLHIENIPEHTPEIEYALIPEDYEGEAYSFVREEDEKRKLILGGTKNEGKMEDGKWSFDIPENTVEIDGGRFPQEILGIHEEIADELYDIELSNLEKKLVTGIRPVRDKGPKLGKEKFKGEKIIDNYGWGAVGWTLSPGASAHLVNQLEEDFPPSGNPIQKSEPAFNAVHAALEETNQDNSNS